MNIYSLFHINTSFSSIEKKDLKKVLKYCYWPLLNLAKDSNYKLCIEASALSLLEIKKIDSKFIDVLKKLINSKKIEFIGSGYTQMVYPIIPFDVNNANLKIGNNLYKSLLGITPTVALVNEQAFSHSLISIYIKNGYKSIIIDWKNCKLANKNLPNYLEDTPGKIFYQKHFINIAWSNSLFFQKFQNYVHGEINIKNYLNFINSNFKNKKNFCLYSNDAEVFNYRPGRFLTESKMTNSNEWKLISNLYERLKKKNKFIFISKFIKNKKKKIQIYNPQFPIITKKQPKYNILRWSLAGRDNVYINTLCYKIYNHLKKNKIKKKNIWKKLCYFWSSDYRTHITEKRWNNYIAEIKNFLKKLKQKNKDKFNLNNIYLKKTKNYKLIYSKNFIDIINDNLTIKINTQKGLTIESYINYKISKLSLIGKIEKGYFNQIDNDVDYFSGFFQLYDRQNNKKITDISKSIKNLKIIEGDYLVLSAQNNFGKFSQKKTFIFDFKKNRFAIKNNFLNYPLGSLRFNYITLNPDNFDFKNLFFETNNGGKKFETFNLNKNEIDYGKPISPLCSATTGLGMTEGKIIIGDKFKKLKIFNLNDQASLIGMIYYKKILRKNLFRFYFSGMEYDDTSKNTNHKNINTFTWYEFLS